jgi:hypothetical protein
MAEVTLDDITRALEGIQEAFNQAPAEGGSIYDAPPDGEYQALVNEFSFIGWDAKSADKPAGIGLKVNYQVTNHDKYAGRIVGAMYNITDPSRIGYLKGFLSTLGVDVEAFDIRTLRPEPGGLLHKLLDTPVVVRVKRSNGFTNVYLLEKVGEPNPSDVTNQQSLEDFAMAGGTVARGTSGIKQADDDIPF